MPADRERRGRHEREDLLEPVAVSIDEERSTGSLGLKLGFELNRTERVQRSHVDHRVPIIPPVRVSLCDPRRTPTSDMD